ncbi:hypothetical protein J9317_07025 [Metabacillus sp. KIGAM252]|uniref:Uncharacterized protein n=1 Tax=Metabacillus flavus TaxID=2823519 RepID=A0ABS5LD95_9BACI|nr:hypothetical protein [Metabacillus flavus]MBS2968508.1 hypothetical protein [Metabacillus flavus]
MDAILAVSQDYIWMNWQVHPVIAAAEKERRITAANPAETAIAEMQKGCQTAAGTADAAR